MSDLGHRNVEKDDMNPKRTNQLFKVFYFGCAILLLVELDMQLTNLVFKEHRHEYHSLEGLLGFYPIYAFGGIVLLVLIGSYFERVDMFIDIATGYALLNLVGALAVAKYLEQKGLP